MTTRIKHGEIKVGQQVMYLNGLLATVLEVTLVGNVVHLLVEVGQGVKARIVTVIVNALTLGVVLVEG
jgi:hypothetical protein